MTHERHFLSNSVSVTPVWPHMERKKRQQAKNILYSRIRPLNGIKCLVSEFWFDSVLCLDFFPRLCCYWLLLYLLPNYSRLVCSGVVWHHREGNNACTLTNENLGWPWRVKWCSGDGWLRKEGYKLTKQSHHSGRPTLRWKAQYNTEQPADSLCVTLHHVRARGYVWVSKCISIIIIIKGKSDNNTFYNAICGILTN